jgi:S-adenosylmethionine/arginine decarboxylase-like enzyme
MESIQSWGYHLLANFGSCDIEKISNEENVKNFSKALVEAIDMVAYGEPQVVNFGTGNKAGFTLVQLIETSNICAHFCNEDGAVYLDVFSCKPFDPEVAIDVFDEFFSPQAGEFDFVERQAPSP